MLSSLQQELKSAMKSGDKARIAALRNMIAKLRAKQIDKGSDLTDSDSIKVLHGVGKQLKDALQQYRNAGRSDLAEKEAAELKVLEEFLPEALSEEDINSIVKRFIAETGAQSMADMGRVMPLVMKEIAGRGDGRLAQQIVREHLA